MLPAPDQCAWETPDEVTTLALEVLRYFNIKNVTLTVVFDGRFTPFSLAGAFRKKRNGYVVLGKRHWPFLPVAIRWQVIVHETCHLVDLWTPGKKDEDFHGPRWQSFMQQCGAEPDVILNKDELWTVARVQACFPRRKWVMHCSCCTFAWGLTTALAERALLFGVGKCTVCGEQMLVSPLPPK